MEPTREIAYLRGNADWRILRDGPALRLRRPGHGDQLLPLRRIRQINSFGAIHWDTEALLACARAGIPVNFCTQQGETRARFLPPKPPSVAPLGQLLEDCLLHRQCSATLQDWLQARKRIELNSLGVSPGTCLATPRKRAEWMADQLPRHTRPSLKCAWRQLECLVRCDLARQLWQLGFDPLAPSMPLRDLPLEQHLHDILLLRLLPCLRDSLDRLRGGRGAGRVRTGFDTVVDIHHQLQEMIEDEAGRLLLQLHGHLLETRP